MYSNLIILFLCIFFHLKKKISFNFYNYKSFLINVNIFRYIVSKLLSKKKGYFRSSVFNKFLKENFKLWKKQKILETSKDIILVESFVNHQGYALCNATIANCYSSRGFYQVKGNPSINGATNVWGYYEKLSEDINGNFNTNVHITFKSLCNGEIYKGDVITSHEYTVNQSEIDKYAEVTKKDSEENKEKAKEEDNNNYYLIEKVY